MKSRTFASSCLLLLLAAPVWGQSPPPPAGGEAGRPLNLSLPRDLLSPPAAVIRNESEDTAIRNLRREEQGGARRERRQPYGTGYEARQRGMTAEGDSPLFGAGNAGMGGGGAGGAGMGGAGGGGGRGGMGRGR